ncbi:MAG: DUF4062 domain-containing protein [Gammaproteobacteria bacterium]|nr:DUF4062 domain-containing protein [Gammaproteobacteria bacterium]
MSENHTIIRIFLASPSGLEKEREAIREAIDHINRRNSHRWLLRFEALGWEDAVGGNQRAQEIINRNLERCDYFFGLLADYWGSPPYPEEDIKSEYTSGFEEEYELAQNLHGGERMLDIMLFFRKIPEDKMRDPGESLRKVLDFQNQVRERRQPLYKEFDGLDDFKVKIEDALIEIGWNRSRQNSGGRKSTSGNQALEKVEPVKMETIDTEQYFFSETIRDFLNVMRNKSGTIHGLSNIEVARLRLISLGLDGLGNDDVNIGVHDANLLYFFRSSLDLSPDERSTLFFDGFENIENQSFPLWHWTDGDPKTAEKFIQQIICSVGLASDIVVSYALNLASIFDYRPPKTIDRGVLIRKWLELNRSYVLLNAAESYLSRCADECDIPVLQQISEELYGQQSAMLKCIIVCIRFRQSENEGFRELLELDPSEISIELQAVLQDAIKNQAPEVLEKLVKQKADYLRILSVKELVWRDALSENLAMGLSRDLSVEVRLEALKTLVDKGKPVSEQQAKQALVMKGRGLGNLIPNDTSKLEDYWRHCLERNTLEELLRIEEENSDPLEADALLMACKSFPDQTGGLLRDLIRDRFQGRFEKRVMKLAIPPSPWTRDIVMNFRARKEHACNIHMQEALDILALQMKREDLGLIREAVELQEVKVGVGVYGFLARFGDWNDVERILKLWDKFEDAPAGLASLGGNAANVDIQLAMAEALAQIGRTRFVDLLEKLRSHELLYSVVKVVSDKAFMQLSDEITLELMHVDNQDVRRAVALRCLQLLPKSKITVLLQSYMKKEERYYNVIHWLDLGMTMPKDYTLDIVLCELQKL